MLVDVFLYASYSPVVKPTERAAIVQDDNYLRAKWTRHCDTHRHIGDRLKGSQWSHPAVAAFPQHPWTAITAHQAEQCREPLGLWRKKKRKKEKNSSCLSKVWGKLHTKHNNGVHIKHFLSHRIYILILITFCMFCKFTGSSFKLTNEKCPQNIQISSFVVFCIIFSQDLSNKLAFSDICWSIELHV